MVEGVLHNELATLRSFAAIYGHPWLDSEVEALFIKTLLAMFPIEEEVASGESLPLQGEAFFNRQQSLTHQVVPSVLEEVSRLSATLKDFYASATPGTPVGVSHGASPQGMHASWATGPSHRERGSWTCTEPGTTFD
jgi:hypothetical protein